jgi:hypothetical protein
MRAILAVSILLSSLAFAQVPSTLGYQGRLLNAEGAPVTGVVSLTFELFADPTNGSAGSGLWSENQNIALADGFYSTTLGSTNPVPSDVFDGSSRFLQIAVAGVPLTPRLPISSVPYAHMATVAKSLAAGSPAVAVTTGATLASAGVAVTGTSTSFTSQLAAGDELMVGSGSNLQSRLVVAIASDTALTVDAPFSPQLVSSTYSYRKPIARLADSTRSLGVMINSRGDVGVGTLAPAAALDVKGDVAIYGRSASLVFNVRSIVDKTKADSYCTAPATAIYVPRSFLGKTGDKICAADARNKVTCAAVKSIYITEDNSSGPYPGGDLKCSDPVPNAWPWGEDYPVPDTLNAEWGHGNTFVVCCK